jgi:bifunctional non-homologous end joining protein LigD
VAKNRGDRKRKSGSAKGGSRLREYQAKRAFERTPEPSGEATDGNGAERARFVIQEHSARRLHWDLRLERSGALASWALPRGIPSDPGENRLAVRTEDHPLDYLEFEGEIPKGEYGAGTMRVWDRGTYACEKFDEDKVIVVLAGERVSGRYALFRTRERDWMIHRMDAPADPDRQAMPEELEPMKATLSKLPSDDAAYGYEIKWDGVRAIAFNEVGRLRLQSRNLRDLTAQYPEIGALARELGAREAILDGELVAFDEEGRPSFQRLQHRMHLASEAAIRRRARETPVTYVIFDLLYLEGRSLMGLPYEERRRLLEDLGLGGPSWQVPAYHRGEGKALRDASRERGLEGIIAKRLASPYRPGKRSRDWLKVKNLRSQEIVIGGWLPGKGRREGEIGALLAGYWDRDDGEPRLRYAGKVGTGFDAAALRLLSRALEPLRRDDSPFGGRQPQRGAIFVEPRLVAEVEFNEWTDAGTLRHPSYKGLRDDKDPTEVVRERPRSPADEQPDATGLGRTAALAARLEEGPNEIEGRIVKLSSLAKVLYPKVGFTKGQVIAYYRAAAPALLPHLRGRPLTLKRYPNGVEGKFFYEKQCPPWRPDWVQTAAVWSDRKQREIDFCLIEDLPTLLWAANLADLEMHTMLARADDLERPTMLVFDLDPGEGAGVLDCAQVALWLRELFDELDLLSVVKSSGSKGLHLHVPLNTDVGYEQTKPFAQAVARLLERQHPERVVSRMARELRTGKVLVDWSQNTAHKSTVCPFSLRARERPTVAQPVAWEELGEWLERGDPERFRIDADAALEGLDGRAELFRPLLELSQELPRLGGD